jgi:hypothetical protein
MPGLVSPNARDLRKISPFGRDDTECHFAPIPLPPFSHFSQGAFESLPLTKGDLEGFFARAESVFDEIVQGTSNAAG